MAPGIDCEQWLASTTAQPFRLQTPPAEGWATPDEASTWLLHELALVFGNSTQADRREMIKKVDEARGRMVDIVREAEDQVPRASHQEQDEAGAVTATGLKRKSSDDAIDESRDKKKILIVVDKLPPSGEKGISGKTEDMKRAPAVQPPSNRPPKDEAFWAICDSSDDEDGDDDEDEIKMEMMTKKKTKTKSRTRK